MQKSITRVLALAPALALWLGSSVALAQSVIRLQESAPDRYIVEKGDTLWGIAGKFLKEPWRWPEIWRMNQDQIRNPNRIYPGNVIVLDRSGTSPQLRLSGTVKLSPEVHSEPLATLAIPAIPPRKIEPFLSQPLIIEEGGLDKAPRIVATQEDRVHVGPGGIAYVSGLGDSRDSLWQIFRAGKPLIDPDSNQTLGFEALFIGTARVTRAGEPATVQILTSKQEITAGDRLIPVVSAGPPQYVPHAPTTAIKGRIIGLYDRLTTSEGGRDSIISINRGRRNGLETGHVLAIYRNVVVRDQQSALTSRDRAPTIQLPDERYGLAFVFRTFDSISYALVMESSRPIQSGDVVQTP